MAGVTGIVLIDKNGVTTPVSRILKYQMDKAKIGDWIGNTNLDTSKIGKGLVSRPSSLTTFLLDLDKKGLLKASNAVAFQANGEYIKFNQLYGERRYAIAFIKVGGFLRLLTINARDPKEHVMVGYDAWKNCRIPFVYTKTSNGFEAINLT